jgi:uncharacterized protein with von Willebrand factor type A (vWA) domain
VPDPALLTSRRLAADHLRGFLHALRAAGIGAVPTKQADFLRAIAEAPPADVTRLYWYARVSLLNGVADSDLFDQVFGAWFHGGPPAVQAEPPAPDEDSDVEAPNSGDDDALPLRDALLGDGIEAGVIATHGRRAFGSSTARQHELMVLLRGAWPECLPTTRSRRRWPAARGRALDMRRTWRQVRRNGGEVVELRWRARPPRLRRLLILIDVSGSLKQHTPDMLRLAHTALHSAPERTEVFTFGTRLSRITDALAWPDLDRALGAVSAEALDVDGGTAIGAALTEFLDNSRYLSLARGALVVTISDGLERGDCTAMVQAGERLARLAHRFVWWSPLACSPTYRPVTRGMAAQLPNLDRLGGVRDLATGLDEVLRLPTVLAGPRGQARRAWPDPPSNGRSAR